MATRAVSVLSETAINQALKRSIATMADAVALTDAAIDAWGPRAYLDKWCKPGDRVVYLRDPARPDWLVAQPVLALEIGFERPEPVFSEDDFPPELRHRLAPKPQKIPSQAVSADPRPGVLTLQEGRRMVQVQFDRQGFPKERMRSCGDPWPGPYDGDRGFGFDPDLLVHPLPQPLSLLCRADLDPDGEPPRLFGRKVADCDNANEERVRVWLPAPVPGGAQITKRRVLNKLKTLSWTGKLDDPGEGWLVVDGFDQTAVATGETLEEAFEAWKAEVARVRPRVPPDQIPTAEQKREMQEIRAAMLEASKGPPAGEGTVRKDGDKVVMKAEMRIAMVPPVDLDWPDECPAVAIPLPPRPAIPGHLAAMGFVRTVRLFGEHGEVAHGFVRPEPTGHLFVGEDAADAVDPATFEETLAALEVQRRKDAEDWPEEFRFKAWHPNYPVRTLGYSVLRPDLKGLGPIRVGGSSHNDVFTAEGFEDGQRFTIHRVARRP